MASSYPSTFDNLTNPTASDKTNSATVPHATQHANVNDIAEALQHKLGLSTAGVGGSSYPSTTVGDVLMVNSTGGHTAWGSLGLSGRNRIINGDMRVWQRGTSTSQLSTADNAYTADRWRLEIGAAGSGRVSQSTSAPAGGSVYSLKLWNDAAGSKNGIFQPVEGLNCWDMRGQAVSVQAKLRPSSTAVDNIRMAIVQSTAGTMDSSASGDPISAWNAAGSNPTLAAPWSYVNTPSSFSMSTTWSTAPFKVENQTVSTAAVNLGVFIWQDSTANSTADFIEVTDVQLERSAFCTPFERRSYALELEMATRYFEKRTALAAITAMFAAGVCVSATDADLCFTYGPKRTTPTVSVSTAADFALYSGAAGPTAAATITGDQIGSGACRLLVTTAGAFTAGHGAVLRANSTTGAAISLSAEL